MKRGAMSASNAYAGQLVGRLEEYRDLGRKEATKHRPPTSATHPDTHEVALKSQADGFVSREQSAFDTVVADADRSTLDANSRVVELRSDIGQALADNTIMTRVGAELASDRTALVDATADRIRAEVAWRGFRATNGITDTAHYPESKILHWAIIIALSLVETIANAFFYRNDSGLLGGFFVALAVAVVNMGSSAGLGTLFRRKNLTEPSQKYFGWAALALFLPLTLFCNALFAAFRSAFEATADAGDGGQLRDAFQTAWAEAGGFFVARFHFGDLSSFLLFMTGLILSIIAFWKGYTSDDPYPGHSMRDRKLKQAREKETKRQDLVKQKLKDFLVTHRNHVQGLSGATGTMITMLSHRTSALGHAKRTLEANTAAVERDYHLVLDSYRQANLAIRGTAPPEYFTEKPNIADKISIQAAAPVELEMRTVLDLLEALQRQHRDDLNGKLNQLQMQMADVLKTTYDEFLETVDRDAQTAVQRDIQILPATA
jgi:hypothetical protein